MIDPSIVDLMHHLDRPIPLQAPTVRATDDARLLSPHHAEGTRRAVERSEVESAAWIDEAERRISRVVALRRERTFSAEEIAKLAGAAQEIEVALDRSGKQFIRDQKHGRRNVKGIRSSSEVDGRLAGALVRRGLSVEARRGLARAELLFALRSLIAEAHPTNGTGPVFDNPKALGAYLRAAIA